jgi:glucose-6-phosphate isomerase
MMRSGDYLNGFASGTIKASCENRTEVIQIAIDKLSANEFEMLIALYERAVGLYATIINVNACHQPGIEAGKSCSGNFANSTVHTVFPSKG